MYILITCRGIYKFLKTNKSVMTTSRIPQVSCYQKEKSHNILVLMLVHYQTASLLQLTLNIFLFFFFFIALLNTQTNKPNIIVTWYSAVCTTASACHSSSNSFPLNCFNRSTRVIGNRNIYKHSIMNSQ